MKPVITAREVEDLIRSGGDPKSLPADAVYTPSARDLLRDFEARRSGSRGSAQPAKRLSSKSPTSELEALFNSANALDVKQQICEVGRRLWSRAYVDGNGGNIAVRVGEDIAICTPTLVSKGFMSPADMCLVDF